MYIARMHLTARVGQSDACVSILRKWQMDVGERVGWKASSTRIIRGALGAPVGEIQVDVRVDSLSDYEGALADMQKVPYHEQYTKELETLLADGSVRWTIHRIVDLTEEAS